MVQYDPYFDTILKGENLVPPPTYNYRTHQYLDDPEASLPSHSYTESETPIADGNKREAQFWQDYHQRRGEEKIPKSNTVILWVIGLVVVLCWLLYFIS